MLDTKYVVKIACIWVTILYVICFVTVAFFSPLRPFFMEYALHTSLDAGVNSVSFVTFSSGLLIWNIITALSVWLFCALYNSIKRHKDAKNDPIITLFAALIVGILVGYLLAYVGGQERGYQYERIKRSGSFMKEKGSSMMQMGKMMMEGGMMMRQKGEQNNDEDMMHKGREMEEKGTMMDEEGRGMMRQNEDMMQGR